MTGPTWIRKRNGLFAAACFRKRGLPLLSWTTAIDELNPSQNRLEEAFIAWPLRNLPDTVRPLLLADKGFGPASQPLLRWLPGMPRHTGQPVDYAAPLKGSAHIQTADGYRGLLGKCPCVLVAMCFCPGRNIVPMGWWQSAWHCTGVRCIGNLGIWRLRCWTAKVVVRQYRKRMQPEQYFHDGRQYFAPDWGTANNHA